MADHLREDFDAVCAERDALYRQVHGAGSASADPLIGLGLVACLELQSENIVLLKQRAETAEAALARIRNKIAEWKDRWPEHRMALNDCADELTILL